MRRSEIDKRWMGPRPAAPGCDCHVCRPERSYNPLDRTTIDTVLRHGWQVVSVTGGPGCSHSDHHDQEPGGSDESGPAFAYTVGLGHRAGHPELLMSGLHHDLMHRALNALAHRVLAGRRLAPGDVVEDVVGGVPVVIEEASDVALDETVLWSGWFHRRTPEALVIVWPGTAGVFAWQPGAPAILDQLQPPRWRVPIEHTGAVAADPAWDFPVPPDHPAFSCTHVVDGGAPVLWGARESEESRGEDWSLHCGGYDHEIDDMRLVHLAHLVRSAPSLREIGDLALGEEALRADPDSGWVRGPLA